MVYKWKAASHFHGDVQTIGEHLEGLRAAHSGLTARLIVDDAKPETSPTHNQFDWDDSEAADKWRLHQARNLLISIVTKTTDDETAEPMRAFVVVTEDDDQHYTSVAAVMADQDLLDQVLRRALRELEVFEKKYGAYKQLAGVITAARKVRKAIER